MQRQIAVLIAVAACTLAGMNAAARLKLRRDALAAACELVKRVMLGVMHTNRPLSALLRCCGDGGTETFLARVADGVERGLTALEAWTEAMEAERHAGGRMAALNAADARTMETFVSTLGTSGRGSQQESAQMALCLLEKSLREAEADYAGKGRVYRTMGLLLGVGLGILLL